MQSTYVVAYDICHPKRLRRVHKLMRGFGEPIQYSVFRCELGPQDLAILRGRLADLIKPSKDQVLFIHLGPTEGRGGHAITSIGKPYIAEIDDVIIV